MQRFMLPLIFISFLAGFGIAFALCFRDKLSAVWKAQSNSTKELFVVKNVTSSEPIILDVTISQATSSDVIRIGLCHDDLVDQESLAVAKALTTMFREGGKQVVHVLTKHGVVAEGEPTPDILICLGYFYPKELWSPRQDEFGKAPALPTKFQNHFVNNVFYPTGMKQLVHKKGRSFLVAFSGEPWDGGPCRYDLMFVTRSDFRFHGCALAYFPVLSTTFAKRKEVDHSLVIDDLDVDSEVPPSLAKRDFMVLVATSCFKREYSGLDALLRTSFFDFVTQKYKKVHGLGHCRRTPGLKPLPDFVEQGAKLDAVTERYQSYKFVITFENQRKPGYITEKILNAVLARSVPIYWGAEKLGGMLNPARYVHCDIDGSALERHPLSGRWESSGHQDTTTFARELGELLEANFTKCLNEIKRLDQNDTAYLEMLRQPFLLNNQVEGSLFDRRVQAHQVFEALRMQQSYLVANMTTP